MVGQNKGFNTVNWPYLFHFCQHYVPLYILFMLDHRHVRSLAWSVLVSIRCYPVLTMEVESNNREQGIGGPSNPISYPVLNIISHLSLVYPYRTNLCSVNPPRPLSPFLAYPCILSSPIPHCHTYPYCTMPP